MHTPKVGRSKQAKANNAITLREGHPAINVKVYHRLDSPEEFTELEREHAWDVMVEEFWSDARRAAHKRGYSGVFAEGRSDGWCVPYYQSINGVRAQFKTWPGQGPQHGYPTYPDVEHDSAERERFRGLQRDIRRMLADVQQVFLDILKSEREET